VVPGLRRSRSPGTTGFCGLFSQKRAVDAVNGSLSILMEKVWDVSCIFMRSGLIARFSFLLRPKRFSGFYVLLEVGN